MHVGLGIFHAWKRKIACAEITHFITHFTVLRAVLTCFQRCRQA
nr:MAG TPA: hypothetical protein [Caudoviricetes sp.]